MTEHHGHLSESGGGDLTVRGQGLIVDHSPQFVFLGEPELKFLA